MTALAGEQALAIQLAIEYAGRFDGSPEALIEYVRSRPGGRRLVFRAFDVALAPRPECIYFPGEHCDAVIQFASGLDATLNRALLLRGAAHFLLGHQVVVVWRDRWDRADDREMAAAQAASMAFVDTFTERSEDAGRKPGRPRKPEMRARRVRILGLLGEGVPRADVAERLGISVSVIASELDEARRGWRVREEDSG